MIGLAPHYLDLQEKTVEQMIDAALLPPLAKYTQDANVPREELWREKVRHYANNAGGTVGSSIGGFVLGLFLALMELLVLAMERLWFIVAPGIFMFILYCLISLVSQPGQWTREMIGAVLLPGYVVGGLTSLLCATGYAVYRAWVRQKEREQVKATEKWGSEPEKQERQLQFGGVVSQGDGDGV